MPAGKRIKVGFGSSRVGLGWWKGVNGELGWDVVGFILLRMSHWDGPCTERREEQHQESACLHLRLSSALKFRSQEGPNHGKTQHKGMTPGALSAQVKMSFKNLNFCLSVLDNPSKPLCGPAANPHPPSATTKATLQCGSGWRELSGGVTTPWTHPSCSRHCPTALLALRQTLA